MNEWKEQSTLLGFVSTGREEKRRETREKRSGMFSKDEKRFVSREPGRYLIKDFQEVDEGQEMEQKRGLGKDQD